MTNELYTTGEQPEFIFGFQILDLLTSELIILNYHDITPHSGMGNRYSASTQQFLDHLDFMAEKNIPVTDIRKWLTNDQNPPLSFAITFDDGYLSQYQLALPHLQKRNMPATFFITTGYSGSAFMCETHWKELSESGYAIGNHSAFHRSLISLPTNDILNELNGASEILSRALNQEVDMFSIPFGRFNTRVLDAIRKSCIRYAFSTRPLKNVWSEDIFLLHRWNLKSDTKRSDLEFLMSDKPLPVAWRSAKNNVHSLLANKWSEKILRYRDEALHQNLIP